MEARPFILLRESHLDELRDRFAEIAARWTEEWRGLTEPPAVTCARAWEMNRRPANWSRCHADEEKTAWFSFAEDFPKELQRNMFGAEQRHAMQSAGGSSLAQQAALAAVDALIGNIAKAVGISNSRGLAHASVPDAVLQRGSGAVVIEIVIGKLDLLCLLNDKCIGAPERKTPVPGEKPLVGIDLKKKLSGTPLSLQVELGSTEVDIGSLLTLQVGDVIRLDSTIDRPLAVIGPEGRKVLNGYLGKQDGNMAIEVAALKQ